MIVRQAEDEDEDVMANVDGRLHNGQWYCHWWR